MSDFQVFVKNVGGEEEGVEFRYFDWDEKGKIIEDENFKLPKNVFYQIPREMKEPKPLYCEQPAVYVLAYVLEMIRRIVQQKENERGTLGNLSAFVKNIFNSPASAQDFLNELDTIKHKMKRDGNGYEIIQNPLQL